MVAKTILHWFISGCLYSDCRSLSELKRRNSFSIGSKCECMCHTKGNIQDYCGYCASSHINRGSKRAAPTIETKK